MTEEKEQIYIVNSRNLPIRIGLIGLILFALTFGWFAVRWQIGNLMADVTQPNDSTAKTVSKTAYGLSSSDPLTNWLIASVKKNEDPDYIEGFETVVRLSPNDFRWWIQLGRAFEEAGKPKEAEKAFLKAIEVSPNYTFPHWQLGNFYLREDRPVDAFQELKKAAENNAVYREQILSIAWDYYDQDTEKLESIVSDSPDVRASLAKFYAAKELPQKSLKIWNTLNAEGKKKNEYVAKVIAQSLFDKRFLLSSVEFVNQLGIEKDAKAETVYNGGFEDEIKNAEKTYFSWKIFPIDKMRVNLTRTKKRSGKRGLQVSFNGFTKGEVSNIYQTIAVKPKAKYQLSFWVKTEDLKSAGNPKLDVFSANSNQILDSSEPFATGTTDWKPYNLSFTIPEDVEGIVLRTSREYCGDNCPLFGTFWYDDFELKRLSSE